MKLLTFTVTLTLNNTMQSSSTHLGENHSDRKKSKDICARPALSKCIMAVQQKYVHNEWMTTRKNVFSHRYRCLKHSPLCALIHASSAVEANALSGAAVLPAVSLLICHAIEPAACNNRQKCEVWAVSFRHITLQSHYNCFSLGPTQHCQHPLVQCSLTPCGQPCARCAWWRWWQKWRGREWWGSNYEERDAGLTVGRDPVWGMKRPMGD